MEAKISDLAPATMAKISEDVVVKIAQNLLADKQKKEDLAAMVSNITINNRCC